MGPSACESLCAPSMNGLLVSSSPMVLLHSCLAGLQQQMLQDLLVPKPDPKAHGNLPWGSEFSLLWESLLNIIIFQFVGHPWGRYGIAYITKAPLLPSFFFFCLFRATPMAHGGSHTRGQIRAVDANLCHSHSNARSKPFLQTSPQLVAMLNP